LSQKIPRSDDDSATRTALKPQQPLALDHSYDSTYGHATARPSQTLRRIRMPWYIWLLLFVVLGSIVGGLLLLRSSARKIPLTEEQKQRIAQRNAEADAEDARNR